MKEINVLKRTHGLPRKTYNLKLITSLGFTLIEVIVVMTLVGALATIVAIPLNMGARDYVVGQNLLRAHELGRGAVWRMERELRELRKGGLAAADLSSLTFTDAYQESIIYSLSGDQLLRNAVPLTESVTAMTLTYYDRNNVVLSPLPLSAANRARVYVISLDLTVSVGGESYSFREQFFPRDLKF